LFASPGFDAFISYRVSTDSDLARKLFDRLSVPTKEQPSPRPYLDQICLTPGAPWEDGFVHGILASQVFVPILSCHGEGRGSVGLMARLAPAAVDNVLLEWEIALELHMQGRIKAIFPILAGPVQDRMFAAFPFAEINALPQTVSEGTRKRLLSALQSAHVKGSAMAGKRTVQEIVQGIAKFQGCMLSHYGLVDNAVDYAVQRAREVME
jgi:hypothetical protein